MEAAQYRVIWTKGALKQLDKLHSFIAKDSIREANKVAEAIVKKTRQLPAHPLKHPPDK